MSDTEELDNSFQYVDAKLQQAEFTRYFGGGDYFTKAKNRGLKGLDKKTTTTRSIHWKLQLSLLDEENQDKWADESKAQRNVYQALVNKYVIDPEDDEEDANLNNPLSTHSESKWNKFFADNELIGDIKKDLTRTHSGSGFFQSKAIQTTMQNILFIWAKLNTEYGYRQGMNELLSIIILCFHRESQERKNDEVLSIVVDRKYAEHDCYSFFCKLMNVMKGYFYVEKRLTKEERAKRKEQKLFEDKKGPVHESPIISKCESIFNEVLSSVDAELHKHLANQGVQPNIFLLRWVRLLFCREFHIEDVMFLWDAIFASAKRPVQSFVLVDHICCSMLYYVRETLLMGDMSLCLRRLLRFPPVEDIRIILMKSLFLFNPKTGNFAIYADIDPTALNSGGTASTKLTNTRGNLLNGVKKMGKGVSQVAKNMTFARGGQVSVVSGAGQPDLGMVPEEDLLAVQRELHHTREIMDEMGQSLVTVVNRMHQTMLEAQKNGTEPGVEILASTIAELKYVKDVLVGNIEIQDLIVHPERNQIVKDTPTQVVEEEAAAAAAEIGSDKESEEDPAPVEVETTTETIENTDTTASSTAVAEPIVSEPQVSPTNSKPVVPKVTGLDSEQKKQRKKKQMSELFSDDEDDDLFSSRKITKKLSSKSNKKKNPQGTNLSGQNTIKIPDFLMGDDDEEDSLF